jgi:hypothetical protein
MKMKDDFFKRGYFNIGNGKNTSFWGDKWLGDVPLSQQYPSLFSIVERKQVSVADVLANRPLHVTFRRTLTPNKWALWLELAERLMYIQLTNPGSCTVKSYLNLLDDKTRYLKIYLENKSTLEDQDLYVVSSP